jgi:uncharacterized protein YdaU (DUF1376 family)
MAAGGGQMSHPWMPFYVADYLADTGHLSTLEHGAYLLLIMHYWQHNGLPENESALAHIARLTPIEWRRARDVLAALFQSGWKHKRIDSELASANAIVLAKSAAGKAGAAARWQTHTPANAMQNGTGISKRNGRGNGKHIADGMADGMPGQWQNDAPSPSPTSTVRVSSNPEAPDSCINVAPSQASGATISQSVSEENQPEIPAALDRRPYPESFEALWWEYRPVASPNATKADAFRAWAKLSMLDRHACWMGLIRYVVWIGEENVRRAEAKRPPTEVKHLATFINRRGWEPFIEGEQHAAG